MKLDELKKKIAGFTPAPEVNEIQSPEGMTVRRFRGVEITVSQLREAVKANPDHPVAQEVSKMLSEAAHANSKSDNHVLTMDRASIEALLTNKLTKTEIVGDSLADGARMTEYRLVVSDDDFVKDSQEEKAATPSVAAVGLKRAASAPENFDKVK